MAKFSIGRMHNLSSVPWTFQIILVLNYRISLQNYWAIFSSVCVQHMLNSLPLPNILQSIYFNMITILCILLSWIPDYSVYHPMVFQEVYKVPKNSHCYIYCAEVGWCITTMPKYLQNSTDHTCRYASVYVHTMVCTSAHRCTSDISKTEQNQNLSFTGNTLSMVLDSKCVFVPYFI